MAADPLHLHIEGTLEPGPEADKQKWKAEVGAWLADQGDPRLTDLTAITSRPARDR